MNDLGKCPICNKQAKIIDSTGELRKNKIHYSSVHSNEYYNHIKDENGEDYIYKFTPARTNPNRFKDEQ